MTFRASQVWDKWLDEDGTFPLADEGGGGCADGFGARDFHCPEEEFGEFYDNPLEDAIVVEELDTGNEKDDCGNDGGKEPSCMSKLFRVGSDRLRGYLEQ